MRSLALLACVLGSAALDACINPCPRRQLMTYVAHTQGGLTKGVDVAARVDAPTLVLPPGCWVPCLPRRPLWPWPTGRRPRR